MYVSPNFPSKKKFREAVAAGDRVRVFSPAPLPNSTPEVIDFEVQNHGSIFLLCPLTASAIEWVDEHLPEDAITFGRGICVEHRFISDIVRGIQDAGLVAA